MISSLKIDQKITLCVGGIVEFTSCKIVKIAEWNSIDQQYQNQYKITIDDKSGVLKFFSLGEDDRGDLYIQKISDWLSCEIIITSECQLDSEVIVRKQLDDNLRSVFG